MASIVNGKITQIKITSAGAGYSAAPTVTITGDGIGCGTPTATIENGRVMAIKVTGNATDNAGGSGYGTATVTLSGPTGTAVLTPAEYIEVLGNHDNYHDDVMDNNNLFVFRRSDVDPKPWTLKCLPNYGDILLDFANLAASRPFRITGPQTTFGYGRTTPVPYVFEAAKFSLGQKVQSEATTMPTTGEYSRGDRVFNTAATERGTPGSKYIVLGWYRLTNGSNHVLNTDWVEMRCLTGN